MVTVAEAREGQDPTECGGTAQQGAGCGAPACRLQPEGSGDPAVQEKGGPACQELQERGQRHLPSTVDVNFAIQLQAAGFWGSGAALLVAGSLHAFSTDGLGSLAGFAASCHKIQARLLHLEGKEKLVIVPGLQHSHRGDAHRLLGTAQLSCSYPQGRT